MNKLSWTGLAVLTLGFFLLGCGGGPRVYKAVGTVTYQGKPVEGAQVTFAYDNGNFANGLTDAAGKFNLTYMGQPGAAPGKCSVTVIKKNVVNFLGPNAVKGPITTQEDINRMSPQQQQEFIDKLKQDELEKDRDLIPARYGDPATSGLRFEITTSTSSNDYSIELKD